MAVGRWRRESVDGIDGRCRCCGVARVTRPRVVLVLLATEPNELRTIYVSGTIQCLRVAGYNCRWWAAVALGGPVSINQTALNTRARARPPARPPARAESHCSRRPIAIAPNAVRAHNLCLAADCRELSRPELYSQSVKITFFRIHL